MRTFNMKNASALFKTKYRKEKKVKSVKEYAKKMFRRKQATKETKQKGGVGGNKSDKVKKFSDKKSGKAFPWSK